MDNQGLGRFILTASAVVVLLGLSIFFTRTYQRKVQKSKPASGIVSVSELVTNPSSYNGRWIRTTGIWVSGFEASSLSDSTFEKNGVTYLKEPTIWISEDVVKDKRDCFSEELVPPVTFCTVDVEGIFEYGDRYGHLGQYEFQVIDKTEKPQTTPVDQPGIQVIE